MSYQKTDLRKGIEDAINRVSAEQGSNTPDFILAEYLVDCLQAFDCAVQAREKWYSNEPASYETAQPRVDASARLDNGQLKLSASRHLLDSPDEL